MTDFFLPFLFGLLAGVLSAWGVGGGTLLLLCMTLLLRVEQQQAQAINLLYFLPTAGISLFFHRKNGYLDRDVLRSAIPLGTLCAAGAALLASVCGTAFLRRPFGLFLLFAGILLLVQKGNPSPPQKK